jgi:hypothetical protein
MPGICRAATVANASDVVNVPLKMFLSNRIGTLRIVPGSLSPYCAPNGTVSVGAEDGVPETGAGDGYQL